MSTAHLGRTRRFVGKLHNETLRGINVAGPTTTDERSAIAVEMESNLEYRDFVRQIIALPSSPAPVDWRMKRNDNPHQVVMGRKMFDRLMVYLSQPERNLSLEQSLYRHIRKFNPDYAAEVKRKGEEHAQWLRENRAAAIRLFLQGQKLHHKDVTRRLFELERVVDYVSLRRSNFIWNKPVCYLPATVTVGARVVVDGSVMNPPSIDVLLPVRVTRISPDRDETLLYVMPLEMMIRRPQVQALLNPAFIGTLPGEHAILYQREVRDAGRWVSVSDLTNTGPEGWVTVPTGALAGALVHPGNVGAASLAVYRTYCRSFLGGIRSKQHAY